MTRIFMVDDESDFTELTGTLLGFHGFDVEACNDPIKAKDRLLAQKMDLVVTDLMMPGLDGFGLVDFLRQQPQYQAVPIIVLSAKILNDQERKFLLQNKVHFQTKPFEPHQLVDQVRHLLDDASSASPHPA